jgi:hypothetical protein
MQLAGTVSIAVPLARAAACRFASYLHDAPDPVKNSCMCISSLSVQRWCLTPNKVIVHWSTVRAARSTSLAKLVWVYLVSMDQLNI